MFSLFSSGKGCLPIGGQPFSVENIRPLRRSRARFPLLSPAVTSSPGAGEVFPLRESQAITFVAKVLGETRKLPAVLLALPLGELSPQVTERASLLTRSAALSQKAARPMITPSVIACGDATLPLLSLRATFPRRVKAFSGGGKVCGSTQRLPLGGAGALAPEGVTPPVKMQSRSVRRRSGFALLKIIFPLFMRKAARRAFQIVPLPASHFSASASLHSTQCRGRNSRHAGGAAV